MKTRMNISRMNLATAGVAISLIALTLSFNNCSGFKGASFTAASIDLNPADVAAGGGAKLAGQGSLSVATKEGYIARIQNGLQNNVSPMNGNFAKGLAQVANNLPKVSDPTKATGYDQVELLVYAACSDLTTGGTPKMQSVYKVNPNNSVASNQAALVSAGMTMLDQYTDSLASQGPTSSQVNTAVTNLVQQLSSDATNTSKIAFMAVCIAANTAGTTQLGF